MLSIDRILTYFVFEDNVTIESLVTKSKDILNIKMVVSHIFNSPKDLKHSVEDTTPVRSCTTEGWATRQGSANINLPTLVRRRWRNKNGLVLYRLTIHRCVWWSALIP